MAGTSQEIILNLIAKTSGANASIKQLQKTVADLSGGLITLGKNQKFYEKGVRGSVSANRAMEVIGKKLTRILSTQVSATKALEAAQRQETAETNKATTAKNAAANGAQTLAQVSQQTMSAMMASGNATQNLTAQMVALTKGEFILTAQGKILNATTKEEAILSDVAAAATARLAREKEELRAAYANATAGMNSGQKAMLNQQMAMNGMANATGSASFAVVSMGQIFQDMGQFGMGAAQGVRAITNNVQQTVQAFVMLSAMTGGAAKGFKAVIATLKGPVGFLALFSLATGAIELISNRMQRARSEAKKMGGAFNEALTVVGDPETDLKKIAVTIEDVGQAIGRAEKNIDDLKKARNLAAQAYLEGNISELEYENERQNIKETIEGYETGLKILEERSKGLEEQRIIQELMFDEEDARNGAAALAHEARMNEARELKDARIGAVVELEEAELDLAEAISTWATNFKDSIFEAKDNVGQLTHNLSLLRTGEGLRLTALELQTKELEKQIDWQEFLNSLQIRGVTTQGIGVGLTPRVAGADGKIDNPFEMKGSLGMSASMREQLESYQKSVRKFDADYEKTVEGIEKSNERFRQSMVKLGTDLIVAGASIGGGLDGMKKAFGGFLSTYGRELIKMGLSTITLGVSLKAVREALRSMNPYVAIAAGAALVAAGSRLKAQGRSSASVMSGGGSSSGGGGYGVSRASFGEYKPFGSRDEFMAGGTGAQFAPALSPNRTEPYFVEFRIDGRDLMGAIDRNRGAERRMGVNG